MKLDPETKKVHSSLASAALMTIFFNIAAWEAGSLRPFWAWELEFILLFIVRMLKTNRQKLVFAAAFLLIAILVK